METVRWQAGNAAAQRAVEAWLAAGCAGGSLLHDNPRRRLVRLPRSAAGDLLVKRFRLASGRHARRERVKALLGRSPARREWRALSALRAAGAPVPEPLALGVLDGGDALLVLRFVEARPLAEALADPPPLRRATLRGVGEAVALLHRAGFVHGDLHQGNVLVGRDGPVILDLQEARRCRAARTRRADLGELDYSLWRRAGLADRLRLRAAALGVAAPFDAEARRRLRAVGRAAERRAFRHGASRTRRALRPGRLYARLALPEGRGLRLRELPEADVAAALAAHRDALARRDDRVLKDDGRSRVTAVRAGARAVVVKETCQRGLGRRIADLLRGSPARRAWRAGHGLLARGIGAALPLAFVERRRLGLPAASEVVLEDLRPARDAVECAAEAPGAAVDALARLLVALQRRGVEHGDLKGSHVVLEPRDGRLEARLLDLEAVRFRRRLSDARRRDALAQLNASLPDAFPAEARRRVFARCAAAQPFAEGSRRSLARVVEQSLARRHRWSGAGCSPPLR
jgi:tRNA A-37 threonylcarbamoyl transferase component Bud32